MRALDNMNYRRTKKILLSDPTGELSEEGDSSVAENDDDDDKSEAVSYLYWMYQTFCASTVMFASYLTKHGLFYIHL